jgi:hypothetical protein
MGYSLPLKGKGVLNLVQDLDVLFSGLALNKPPSICLSKQKSNEETTLQKNKLFVISILAALLVSCALSVAAAQEVPQLDPTKPVSSSPAQPISPSGPVEGDQYVPGVGTATTTGPDGVSVTVANVTLPMPLVQDKDVPASDVNGNTQSITGQNDDGIAPEPGNGEVVPIYAVYENTAVDNSAAVTAVGLVVAALAMGAVGIVCLSKHP